MSKLTCAVCHRQPVDPSTSREQHIAFRMMCAGCLAKFDTWSAANVALAQREQAGDAPPYTDADRNTLMGGALWNARVKDGVLAYKDLQRNQRRTGAKARPATEWLRRQGPDRGRSALYWDWLDVDGGEDSRHAWDRFRKLWKQYFGGK